MKFVAAALLAVAVFSYFAFASTSLSAPAVVNNNTTTINGVPIANASVEGGVT